MAAERRRPAGDRPGAGPARRLREEVLDILVRVETRGESSSLLLERARVEAGADRGLATELVLGCLRRQVTLDALAAELSERRLGDLDPVVRVALRLGLHQLAHLDRVPAYAAVSETVEAVKRAGGRGRAAFVNGLLRAYLRRRGELSLPGPGKDGHLAVTLGLGHFLAGRWSARFGRIDGERMARAALEPSPLTVRVLGRRGTVEEAVRALAAEGVEVRPGRHDPRALTVVAGSLLAATPFRDGRLVVQDEAAQLVAGLVALRPGQSFLDVCAAPGGKTVAVIDRVPDPGRVVALDHRPGRLRLMRRNLERAGLAGVELVAADGARPPLGAAFDRILVDAPCTGTGTIGRNPELRHRIDDDALARSRSRAEAILAGALGLLPPGGRLVYATCSLEPEENELVVDACLERDRAVARLDPRPELPPTARPLVGDDLVLRTWPGELSGDGFTAFVLERRSA